MQIMQTMRDIRDAQDAQAYVTLSRVVAELDVHALWDVLDVMFRLPGWLTVDDITDAIYDDLNDASRAEQ